MANQVELAMNPSRHFHNLILWCLQEIEMKRLQRSLGYMGIPRLCKVYEHPAFFFLVQLHHKHRAYKITRRQTLHNL